MYTFITFNLKGELVFEGELEIEDPEFFADRLQYWGEIIPTRDEECIALIVEE